MSAVKEAINECLQGVNTPRTTKAKIEEVVNMGDGGGGGGGKGYGDGTVTPATVEGSSRVLDISEMDASDHANEREKVGQGSNIPSMEDLEKWVEDTGVDLDLDDTDGIEEMDFSESKLDCLPNSLVLVSANVRELAVEKNSITKLPGNVIGSFGNLVELYLRENQITEIPEEIGKCAMLDR